MNVTADIRKLDLMKLNLFGLPRARSTYIAILIIAALIFSYMLWDKGFPEDGRALTIYVLSSFMGGLFGMVFGVVFSMITILFMSTEQNGVLGEHTYTLLPEGFHEQTSANESLTKWHGIVSVRSIGPYLLIQIASCLFYVVPKRSFGSLSLFQEFKAQAVAYWKQAQTNNGQA